MIWKGQGVQQPAVSVLLENTVQATCQKVKLGSVLLDTTVQVEPSMPRIMIKLKWGQQTQQVDDALPAPIVQKALKDRSNVALASIAIAKVLHPRLAIVLRVFIVKKAPLLLLLMEVSLRRANLVPWECIVKKGKKH